MVCQSLLTIPTALKAGAFYFQRVAKLRCVLQAAGSFSAILWEAEKSDLETFNSLIL